MTEQTSVDCREKLLVEVVELTCSASDEIARLVPSFQLAFGFRTNAPLKRARRFMHNGASIRSITAISQANRGVHKHNSTSAKTSKQVT